jgi:hypothetical protein
MVINVLLIAFIVGAIAILLKSKVPRTTDFFASVPERTISTLLKTSKASKFFPKKPLSEPEQILYWKLLKSLPEQIILAQVGFSRILYTKGGTYKGNFSKFSTAKQKVADFVICDKTFYILAVIELDDSTHDKEKDRIRDEMLNQAGLKTIRWSVNRMPTEEEIHKAIFQ